MVLITGVIKNTDGTPYVGSVKFALNDLGIELNTVYLPTVVTVDSDGTFTVDLWPNTNSLTSTYYKCSLDNGSVFNVSIPGNNLSYNLGDVILIDPGTLDPGILQRLNLIETGITTRVSDLEHYTGIADNRIPSIAISGDYPYAVAGKVSKILTIGDGLTGGTYRGDTDVTVAVDGTVIRATDDRLSDDREWVAQTAPIEVVSQPTNTTRYAWTPQRIWDTIVSWFSTITSDDIQEGSDNLYYTNSRVANNLAVQANTNKVSATGPVTTHSDITSAGSGQIITTSERTKLSNIEDNAQVNTVNSVAGKTGDVVLDSSDVGLGNVPNIDTTNANNITSGTLSGSRLSYGTAANTPAQGNDARFTDSREWTASTVSQSVAQAGTDTNRHAWTSQRVRDNVSFYTQPYTSTEKSKLAGLNSADYLPVGGTAVNSQLLDNIDSSQFLRSDTNDTFYGTLSQANNNNPALVCRNSSYPGNELQVGGWTSSNSNNISRIRNSNQNLHIDCAANGGLYLNWYTNGRIFTSSPLSFYNKTRTEQLGDIGSDNDTNWFKINDLTDKNIYTPRMFRADGGFQVDGKWVVSNTGDTLYEGGAALSSKYLRKDISGTSAGRIVFTNSQSSNLNTSSGSQGGLELQASGTGSTAKSAFMSFHRPEAYAVYFGLSTSNQLEVGGWSMGNQSYKIWHAGNDGAGSGLDADLWGGWQRDNYLNQAVRDDSNVSFSGLSFGSTTKQHINLWSTSYGLGVQTDTAYWRSNNNFALFKLGVHSDTALEAGSGGIRVFDYQGLVNQFNFNAYVNFNADGLKITGVSPTLHLEDTDHRSFWLHNNSNTFYILSDRNDDGAWEAPYPAYWNDISQKSYFWGNEVAVHNTTPKFSGIDIYNGTKKFGLNTLTDNFFYIQQFAGDNQTLEGNIIRFSTTEVRHYVPLVNGSSRHIKDIKGDLPDGLDLVNRLNPVVYNYKGQDNTEVGLIAEEVPPGSHLVYGSGHDMAIDYTKLPIYMIDAIQQLTKRVEALEEKAKKQ